MIGNGGLGGKVGGGGVDLGGKPVGKDGIIKPSENSPQPREGSRDINEGLIISEPPDWCKRPDGTLIPYTIWAVQTASANLANGITQTGDRSHAKESLILHCHGDEKGWPNGGVKSGTVCAECTPKTWSETVFAEGRNMVRHDDEWWMNHKNTWGRLHYAKEPAPYTTPQVDEVQPKMWLAQAERSEWGSGRGAERDSLIPPPRGMESWDWSPPRTQPYYPPTIEPPGRPANDDQPATPTLVDPRPQTQPFAGPQTSVGPDAGPVPQPGLKRDILTVRGRRVQCDCLIGQYSEIDTDCKTVCKGKTHHIAPDMIYRLGKRPTSAEDMASHDNRTWGAPSLNEGMSICISGDDHKKVHDYLRSDFKDLGSKSEVPGTAKFSDIWRAARSSLSRTGQSLSCRKEAISKLNDQTRMVPYTAPGRVQENLPLSPTAVERMTRGFY